MLSSQTQTQPHHLHHHPIIIPRNLLNPPITNLPTQSMRRAFIAPLLLRRSSRKSPHPAFSPVRNPCITRHTSARHYRMSLAPIEEYTTTPFPESAALATTLLKWLPATLTRAHEERLQALLSSSAGTRGLFVALLSTEEVTLAEAPVHEGLFTLLHSSAHAAGPDGSDGAAEVLTLGVKNVVMSSAMGVTYRGRGETELAGGSDMTRRRGVNVLRVLDAGEVAREMVVGLREGKGRFGGFARKWGYGEEEIRAAVEGLREACGDGVLEG